MKKNSLIIGVVIVVIFLLGMQLGLFAITGNERMARSYPSIADPGATVNIVYAVSGGSGLWGASVQDVLHCNTPIVLPSGWKGDVVEYFVIISDEGNTKTIQYTLPDTEGTTCTLSGNYKFGDEPIISFSSATITTRITTIVCAGEFDTNCNGIIDRTELRVAISQWISGSIDRDALGGVIQNWASN